MFERRGAPINAFTFMQRINMRSLLIIPAYNEAENIERVVNNVIENYPSYDYLSSTTDRATAPPTSAARTTIAF